MMLVNQGATNGFILRVCISRKENFKIKGLQTLRKYVHQVARAKSAKHGGIVPSLTELWQALLNCVAHVPLWDVKHVASSRQCLGENSKEMIKWIKKYGKILHLEIFMEVF